MLGNRAEGTKGTSQDPKVQVLLADREEPAVVAPHVARFVPAQVEFALAFDPTEGVHAAITVGIDPDGAERHDRKLLLFVRVLGPEREQLWQGRRPEVHGLQRSILLNLA